jgi:AraC-like DNA-binding protein
MLPSNTLGLGRIHQVQASYSYVHKNGRVADPAIDALAELLTDVPHVMFCVKDSEGRYIAVNQAFADRVGKAAPADVVGLTAIELFPEELATSYERQDAWVRANGRPLRNQLEVILRPDRSVGWYVTSKTLIAGATIASVSVDLRTAADAAAGTTAGVAAAVAFARAHSTEPLTVAELATAADLTVPQLERAIKRTLGLSTKQVLLRMRLEEAILRLRTTDAAVAQIATDCGYYDQSAFTRQFRRVVGMSPGAYRSALHP